MGHPTKEDLLDDKGREAIKTLLTMGYTKEEIGELLEILLMGEIRRRLSES